MVDCGLTLAITTHSDIILQHINNMIRLSGRKEQNEICQELGYTSEELLRPQQVRFGHHACCQTGKDRHS